MDCVFIKARKISKALKGNRGSVIKYSKYILRELPKVDYSDKGRLIESGIFGTDETAEEFWKKVEERENQTKRKSSARFAKEYIVALPYQLPLQEKIFLAKEIGKGLANDGRRVVQFALHEPDKEGDERNWHIHFLLSERAYINKTFAETKNRDWNSKAWLNRHKIGIGKFINESMTKFKLPPIKIKMTEEDKENAVPDRTERQIHAKRAKEKKSVRTALNEVRNQLFDLELNNELRKQGLSDNKQHVKKRQNISHDML